MINSEQYNHSFWERLLFNETATEAALAVAGYPGTDHKLYSEEIAHLLTPRHEGNKCRHPKHDPHADIYLRQIAKAQEFLEANHNADLSQVKCLLRTMLPKEHYDRIDQLHETRSLATTININGGQNIIAPNAKEAKQQFRRKK